MRVVDEDVVFGGLNVDGPQTGEVRVGRRGDGVGRSCAVEVRGDMEGQIPGVEHRIEAGVADKGFLAQRQIEPGAQQHRQRRLIVSVGARRHLNAHR